MNLVIASFEPDNGFTDTFLSMDSVYEDNYSGTRRFSYGAKYNTVANIDITVIKQDGSDFSTQEFRQYAQWTTGARTDSWLDMYAGDQFVYSFLGKFINLQHYRLDARTVGLKLTFESVAPWAFSAKQSHSCHFGQQLYVNNDGYLYVGSQSAPISMLNQDGVLYAGPSDDNYFTFMDESVYDGIVFIDNTVIIPIDNQTDDLYTYINLDTQFINENCDYISMKNLTLNEETKIINMSINENITLSSNQFISSNIPNKIFGDDFNFVWPKIAPGLNEIAVSGSGSANVQFIYRYPMKIGDNVVDVDLLDNSIFCS